MKFLEASISMNSKRMDENDVFASAASPADYIPYFSFVLDHKFFIPSFILHHSTCVIGKGSIAPD